MPLPARPVGVDAFVYDGELELGLTGASVFRTRWEETPAAWVLSLGTREVLMLEVVNHGEVARSVRLRALAPADSVLSVRIDPPIDGVLDPGETRVTEMLVSASTPVDTEVILELTDEERPGHGDRHRYRFVAY